MGYETVGGAAIFFSTIVLLGYLQGRDRERFAIGTWPLDCVLAIACGVLSALAFWLHISGVGIALLLLCLAGTCNWTHTIATGKGAQERRRREGVK